MGAAIQVRDAAVRYGAAEILEHIDLTVGTGEVVAVVGRSGSGKTTLLRLIAGAVPPASGSVALVIRPSASYANVHV